jgi:hypothetical protein
LRDALRALSARGVLCMTFMEGSSVTALLGGAPAFRNSAITLERATADLLRVRLEDSAYFGDGFSTEHLVHAEQVCALADAAGFECEAWGFDALARELRPRLTDDEAVASALNVALLLRKRPAPPALT